MEDAPLVSFVILDIKNHHLAPRTIESILEQTEKRFEIIVMIKDISPHDFHILREYAGKIQTMQHTAKSNHAEIMNQGIKLSEGKYIHFLFPGEIYVSKYSLEYAAKKIESKNFPDLLCFSFFRRDVSSPPEIKHASFSVRLFGGERFPIFAKDCLFLKDKLKSLGKFNPRYRGLESFDMISKIYKKGRFLCCRRVLVDFELEKKSPKDMVIVLKDLLIIIYRNFGILSLFHWYVMREIKDLFIWWLKGIKQYFTKTE